MLTKRLLIIEDDYDVAEMLLMYFTANKYEVYHADNGIEGLEIARTKFPNLILLDVMLPHMNGYEVCTNLRGMALTKHIPVIFLTQKDERSDKVAGLQLGADDYIAKPFDVDELRLRVQRSIERATRESLHERRTGLPTGVMVEDERSRAFRENDSYREHHLTIAGFNTFADVYGFMSADQVMGFAAGAIRDAIGQHGTERDFIGLDGDRFVILSYGSNDDAMMKAINESFEQGARAFYTFMDVDQGGILLKPGTDDEQLVPLMHIVFHTTESQGS